MKVIVFSLLTGLLLLPSMVQACSCLAPPPPLEALKGADAVFVGRVNALHLTGTSFEEKVNALFEVDQVWKGSLSDRVVIETAQSSAACGFHFSEGEQYLVYAFETEGALETNICSRTTLLENAQGDLSALGEPDQPPFSLAAVLMLALVVLFLLRRK